MKTDKQIVDNSVQGMGDGLQDEINRIRKQYMQAQSDRETLAKAAQGMETGLKGATKDINAMVDNAPKNKPDKASQAKDFVNREDVNAAINRLGQYTGDVSNQFAQSQQLPGSAAPVQAPDAADPYTRIAAIAPNMTGGPMQMTPQEEQDMLIRQRMAAGMQR